MLSASDVTSTPHGTSISWTSSRISRRIYITSPDKTKWSPMVCQAWKQSALHSLPKIWQRRRQQTQNPPPICKRPLPSGSRRSRSRLGCGSTLRYDHRQATLVRSRDPPIEIIRLSPRSRPPRYKGNCKTRFSAIRVFGLVEDRRAWARTCQWLKVSRHTSTPVGVFALPTFGFQHLNIDIIAPLPTSGGFRYCLTAVDHFSPW